MYEFAPVTRLFSRHQLGKLPRIRLPRILIPPFHTTVLVTVPPPFMCVLRTADTLCERPFFRFLHSNNVLRTIVTMPQGSNTDQTPTVQGPHSDLIAMSYRPYRSLPVHFRLRPVLVPIDAVLLPF